MRKSVNRHMPYFSLQQRGLQGLALFFFPFFLSSISNTKLCSLSPVNPAHQAREHLLKKFFRPFIPSSLETSLKAVNQVMCKMLMKPSPMALHCNALQKLKTWNSLLAYLKGGIL